MTFRRVKPAVLLLAAILAVLAGVYFRQAPDSANSLDRIPAHQNEALLARAWALPVARLYGPLGYLFQENQSLCGPTSIADVVRSEGLATDSVAVLSHSNARQIAGFLPLGLTLDEEAKLLQRETDKPVKVLRGLSLDSYRAELAKSDDPGRRIIINFLRTPLFGRGHGRQSRATCRPRTLCSSAT